MTPEETLDILRRAPVIGLLPEEALRIVASVGDPRRLRPDEVLFRQGERSDGGYVVLAGTLSVGREGDEQEIALLGPGSLVGQLALFVRMHRPATVVAREASTVLRISPTLVRRVLEQFPNAAPRLHDAIAEDLGEMVDGLEAIRERFSEPSVAPS